MAIAALEVGLAAVEIVGRLRLVSDRPRPAQPDVRQLLARRAARSRRPGTAGRPSAVEHLLAVDVGLQHLRVDAERRPSRTTKSASLPFSSEPRRWSRCSIFAALRVSAFSAAASVMPPRTAIAPVRSKNRDSVIEVVGVDRDRDAGLVEDRRVLFQQAHASPPCRRGCRRASATPESSSSPARRRRGSPRWRAAAPARSRTPRRCAPRSSGRRRGGSGSGRCASARAPRRAVPARCRGPPSRRRPSSPCIPWPSDELLALQGRDLHARERGLLLVAAVALRVLAVGHLQAAENLRAVGSRPVMRISSTVRPRSFT